MKAWLNVLAVLTAASLSGCGDDGGTSVTSTDTFSSMLSSARASVTASQAAQDAGVPAKQFILESLMQPPDGKFSDVSCADLGIDPCWPPLIDSFTMSSGSSFLTVTMTVGPESGLGQAQANKASQDIADLLRSSPDLKDKIIGVRVIDRSGKTLAENPVQ